MQLRSGLLLLIPLLSVAAWSQLISDLPKCWQNCIKSAGDFSCNALDLSCICRLSSSASSNFLTTALTCIRTTCDNNLDSSLLLTPLQLACDLAGQPIPTSDITAAENAVATSYSSTYTVTPGTIYWTSNSDSGLYTPDPPTAAASSAAVSSFFAQTTFPTVATTVSTIVTDSAGSSVQVIVPVTIEASTTIYGTPETFALSTTTTDSAAAAASSGPPFVTTTTTTSTSSSSSSSTSSSSFNGAAFTSSIESDISAGRSSASAASASASSAGTTASSSSGSSGGNGSPFDQQGGASAVNMQEAGKKSLLGVAVMVAVGVVWF